MVTGPLYEDLAVLQACAAYEQAAGQSWPTPDLAAALARAEDAPAAAPQAKIRPVSPPA